MILWSSIMWQGIEELPWIRCVMSLLWESNIWAETGKIKKITDSKILTEKSPGSGVSKCKNTEVVEVVQWNKNQLWLRLVSYML